MKQFMFADTAVSAAAPAATTTTVQPAADGAAAPKPAAQQQGGFTMLLPMILIFALFYIMMIRPQQRKEKERRKMIDELRAGAKVLFAGGFVGKIVEAKERTFRIELAQDVVVEVARSSVQSIITDEAAEVK